MLDILEMKLASVQAQKEQAVAQYNAILGAEQAVKQLIEEFKKRSEQESKPETNEQEEKADETNRD